MLKKDLRVYSSILSQGLSIRMAAKLLNVAPTTVHRRLKKFQSQGNLTHGNTGKQNRKPRKDKDLIIELVKEKYNFDFSISHLCELLEERESIKINRETLRLWLKRKRVYKKKKQYQYRECMPCFGDLLQIDGSFEHWFGEEKSCLLHIVDDATKISELHFAKEETIVSACQCAWKWFLKYGVPRAFYSDGRNMYHLDPDREHNFFTAMCERLGIRVILAHSPQAKGRVERYNGVHQNRLIPLFKLDGVKDMINANKYLENYIIKHNQRFSKPSREGNSHTPLPDWANTIDDVCYIEVERILRNDWTLSYNGKIYQLPRQSIYPPAKSKIKLKITISGSIKAFYRGYVFELEKINT